ncbi:MAG: dipeptide ABC transporter ATP-binding protein [Neomegalonema sp.]|nr:dipeptide ABC transporter ATP-binding protein [Neomegalonema sp.]
MTLLTVEKLCVSIGGASILDQVSFDVAPGEILGLIGESGSGKSVTALSIMGLPPQGAKTKGSIKLAGEDILTARERRLCQLRGQAMGMVFQEPMTALNPLLPIGAQVAETILVHERVSKAEALERASQTLARVGLPPATFPLSRYPHELSGGQRQRVGIAIAIAMRPKLLIADEPTTALDVTTQAQVLDLLKGLVDELQMGMVMITHDLAVISTMAKRLAVMQSGRIVETAATEELLRKRRHPYSEALFAASTHKVELPPPPAAQRTLLEARDVLCAYPLPRQGMLTPRRALRAVDGVTFTLARGERLGLVGESGCGKSTLSRALLGLEPLQSGSIMLNGAPVRPNAADTQWRRTIQAVFQDPYGGFNPRWRVRSLISEPFHLLEEPPSGAAREDAVVDALTAVGLCAADADKYIHEFSGGQRQRIAIARALIIQPELILFDEAVSALDVSVRAQILDLLAELCRKRALSYLFISHDLAVVRSVTDRVMVMQAGKIVEQGATEQVFSAPQHECTRNLLASAPKLQIKNSAFQ